MCVLDVNLCIYNTNVKHEMFSDRQKLYGIDIQYFIKDSPLLWG
jgi:hypothetical protein